MTSKKQVNFLNCLPDQFAAYKSGIELFVSEELALFSSRLESSLLREIATPHGRPSSVTTAINHSASVPEVLSLDGLSHKSKGSDLSKQLISVQVREFHIVDNGSTPAVLYTISSAFAGGYNATVYRMQEDIDVLYNKFGRRAQVARFVVPDVGNSKSLHKSCGQLRAYLLHILRCPAALGNKALFAWFGLDRAFASTKDDEVLMNAFEDVWRLYYSDEERVFTDNPEDALTMYITERVKNANEACFAEVKSQGGQAAELQCIKCVMLYVRQNVCNTWAQWTATAPVLSRKFALLPDGEFADAVDEVLAEAKKPLADAMGAFNGEAVAGVKSMLRVITPLAKAVRHTMREYRPRKQTTFLHLLTAQPGDLADYKFDNLETKLARVKSKVKGALEFAARTYEKELALNVKADGGEDSVNAKLLPFMRKIPTLARALFYLSQPTVMTNFIKNFLLERERLCAAGPTGKAKDSSAIDVFADRMSHVLTFLERDLSFSDSCVKSDFIDEVLSTHDQDKSLPTNSRLSCMLRSFYGMLSRLVALKMQFFVNMTKMFVNTVNDMGLEAVMSLQLRIAMVRSASQTAFLEASAVYERQLMRQIPEMIVELVTAMITVPAKETLVKDKTLNTIALSISRTKDPSFSAFLDVNNLVEMALNAEIRTAVEPTVREWWQVSMNRREYDPARTAAVVNERKKKKHALAQPEPSKEQAVEEKPKKKKKGKKKAAEPEPVPEKEPEPEKEAEPAKEKKKKKKKVAVAA